MTTPITDPPADEAADSSDSHLEAARAAFAAPAAPAAAAPPSAAPATPAKPDSILAGIVKPPAAPTSPPAAPAPLDDIDKGLQAPPDNAKSRAGWDELKKRATEERQRRVDLESRLKAAEEKVKTSPPPLDDATRARLAELEQENQKYSARLKVLDLRSHPEFVEKFTNPLAQAKADLAAVVKSDESDVNVEEILGLKGKAFNTAVSTALESLTPYARVRFQAALDRFISTDLAATQALSTADEFLKTANQNTGARSREAFDRVASEYREHFVPVPVDDSTPEPDKVAAAEYNTALGNVSKQAEKFAFGFLDEKTAAALAHKAALYDFTIERALPRLSAKVESLVAARDARIAELETQVKSLTAAAPGVSSGSGAGSAAPANSEQSHLDAARGIAWGR